MKNILVSTTRQWNCGDEFILFGTIRLVEDWLGEKVNWCVYDRNPDIRDIRRLQKVSSDSWNGGSIEKFDYVVIAGSPEWHGPALKTLFEKVEKFGKQIIFLGVGMGNKLSNFDCKVLRSAKLITTRDDVAKATLSRYNLRSHLLPCPALFASSKLVNKVEDKIGITIQSNKIINHRVSREVKELALIIQKEFNCPIICHYIDEYIEFLEKFDVRYSFSSDEYINIYREFGVIISTRLHGAIVANSLGIPAILINNDKRCVTAVEQFPHIIKCDSIAQVRAAIKVVPATNDIAEFKEEIHGRYMKLLQRVDVKIRMV